MKKSSKLPVGLDTATNEIVEIFTDGSSLGNPGPGGWCAVLKWKNHRKIISQGYHETTNNRMEIRGALHALEALTRTSKVTLKTDSRYVCDAVEKRWIHAWIKNGWKTSSKQPVKNRDLWEQLIPLIERHDVKFVWIKGHAGDIENELCDKQAKLAATGQNKKTDTGYKE